jgi:hypothetical protein
LVAQNPFGPKRGALGRIESIARDGVADFPDGLPVSLLGREIVCHGRANEVGERGIPFPLLGDLGIGRENESAQSSEPLAIRAMQVEEVRNQAPQASIRCRGSGHSVAHGALVRVQFYTAFGLPWSAMVVEACDAGWTGVSRVPGGVFEVGMAW